jgi:hypothetical protein
MIKDKPTLILDLAVVLMMAILVYACMVADACAGGNSKYEENCITEEIK